MIIARKQTKFKTKLEVEIKKNNNKRQNPFVSFGIVTFAIHSNNNGNLVVGGRPEFFQFLKRDISTARCKRIIYIFKYKGINVVIRTEFINMTLNLTTLLSM